MNYMNKDQEWDLVAKNFETFSKIGDIVHVKVPHRPGYYGSIENSTMGVIGRATMGP